MTNLVLVIGLGLVALAGGLVALRFHLRKRDQMALRLVAGRRLLLDDQIEERLQALGDFDDDQIASQTRQSLEALDHLNVLLIERQSHLLNLEDLTHLQGYKINIVDSNLHRAASNTGDIAAPHPQTGATEPDHSRSQRGETVSRSKAPRSDDAAAAEPPHRDRAELEQQVLSRINQLNRPGGSTGRGPKKGSSVEFVGELWLG